MIVQVRFMTFLPSANAGIERLPAPCPDSFEIFDQDDSLSMTAGDRTSCFPLLDQSKEKMLSDLKSLNCAENVLEIVEMETILKAFIN
ncbi:MAG: hypothetical protein QOJ64_408 [Acidobacteriota bacterium]|nr:hypothetical protein [Acidobacteriota bacterium]